MAIFRSQPSVANQSRATDGSRRRDHFYARLPSAARERVATIESGPSRRCSSSSAVESTFFRGGVNLKVKSRQEDRRAALTKIDSCPFRHSACSRIRLLALRATTLFPYLSLSLSVTLSFTHRPVSRHSSNLTPRNTPSSDRRNTRGHLN